MPRTSLTLNDLKSVNRVMMRRGYQGRATKFTVSFKGPGQLYADDVTLGAIIMFMFKRGYYSLTSIDSENIVHAIRFKRHE